MRPGDAVMLEGGHDDLHRHAPLVCVLRYGKRSRQAEIPVHLSARFTELGPSSSGCNRPRRRIDGACSSSCAVGRPTMSLRPPDRSVRDEVLVPDEAIVGAEALLEDVFAGAESV